MLFWSFIHFNKMNKLDIIGQNASPTKEKIPMSYKFRKYKTCKVKPVNATLFGKAGF